MLDSHVIVAIRAGLALPSITLKTIIMRNTFLVGIVCLFLSLNLTPNFVIANTNHTSCSPSLMEEDFGGGFIVVIQGLQDNPTRIQVPFLKSDGGQNIDIEAIILADDGTTVHTLTTEKLTLDFSELVLSTGEYVLIVEVGTSVHTLDFSVFNE